MFLKISQNSQRNTCARITFLIKSQSCIKETQAHVLSCGFCEIFRNAFNTEHLQTTASVTVEIRKCKSFVILWKKHPPEVFYKRSCSLKFSNIHRKTSVLESIFIKVVFLKACNSIKKRLQHRFFPVKFAEVLRTPTL